MIDRDNGDRPVNTVDRLNDGSGESDNVDRFVELGDLEDKDEKLFTERNSSTHSRVSDQREHSEDRKDDSSTPELLDPVQREAKSLVANSSR